MTKKILFILFIVLISGSSAIIADRYLFPYLAATRLFSKYEFLKKSAENVTVINKTEQVYVAEDSSVAKLMSPVVSSVVNIISYGPLTKNGTGVIATSDGIIMTYSSAIIADDSFPKSPQASDIKYKIMTSDGNAYDAQLLGIDSWSNLAFLKINASNLSVISFGNPEEYGAGEKVIAIGNDYPDYQNRFVSGIISGFNSTFNISGHALSVAEKLEGVFRGDFSFENIPDGGPVVDYSGHAVGLAGSVKIDGKNQYFIISSDKAKMALDKIIKKEKNNNNPVLGIYYLPVTKTLALSKNLNIESGAMIYSPSGQQGLAVIAGSPAALAGLKISDVITQINSDKVTAENNISTLLYKYKKGDAVEFTVIRAEEEIKIKVQL